MQISLWGVSQREEAVVEKTLSPPQVGELGGAWKVLCW